MLTRLLQQPSNFSAARRIAAIACLVALCGIVFGVGAAFGRPGGVRAARVASHARAHKQKRHHAHRAHRVHRARKHKHKHLRRMVVHAALDRRGHHRHHHKKAAHHAWKRHHRAQRRLMHGLMMRDVSTAKAAAAAAARVRATVSQAGGAVTAAMALPASGSFAASGSAPSTATRLNPTLSGSAMGQLDVIATRVREVAVRSQAASTTTSTTTRPAASHAAAARKPAHHGAKLGGGFTFPFVPQPSQIERFVNVIPESIWLALASAFALAGLGGAAAVRSSRRARRQAGEFAAVAAVALTDPLTGVLNRRGFVEAAERELARARRYQSPFVLAYVDVRGLKAVNDSEGHLAGDEVIKQVAELLGASVRAEDSVGRLGGDELALLLTGQSARGAEAVVERIHAEVPAYREAAGIDTDWGLTIGTAAYPADGTTFDELVATADRRLYEQRGIQLR